MRASSYGRDLMAAATAPSLDAARRLLAERFGLAGFRPGQAEVIDALLAGRSALAVFPTGSGKSLCYQLPALLLDGVTVVVSPLIALMKDQIDALAELGVPAARIDSSLSFEEVRDVSEQTAPPRAPPALRGTRALQQRALRGPARGRGDRALRRRRGSLHLGVGPQLPSRLPQARAARARAGRRPGARPHRDRDARRRRRHLRRVRHRARRCHRDRRLPPQPHAPDDARGSRRARRPAGRADALPAARLDHRLRDAAADGVAHRRAARCARDCPRVPTTRV